ncbi:glycosyltransferase [Rhizobium sp. RU36D]|uniref:glycosyltransferase n=1 Tax=Rhizobium sp. RU36D TaxID=1907415 RepID=UPI0009D7C384|nr:glycosyltransferase [Rhizobium sp. RU36D]SMD08688.1 Glycosyltransferase involved in cell wall bisynthesis [Rhizobium sp. RU36D]
MADRLRVLQVLEPSGGGSGRHFVDLCQGLQQAGHEVTAIYSPTRAESRFVEELAQARLSKVIALPMRRSVGPWDLSTWRQLQAILRDVGRLDIIHGHSSKAGALTRLRRPGRHVPRIYTPHAFRTMDPTLSAKGRALYGGVEWLLGRYLSDRVICVSKDELEHAIRLGLPRERLRLVINGVTAPAPTNSHAIRRRFGISVDAVLFGFIGRLSPQKAPERLLNAFVRLATEIPQAHLLMIGSGELESDIRHRIDTAGLAGRVHLASDIPGSEAVGAFDVLVMPSRYEAMSYVMLEAAAAGKPMLLADVGGASTVLEHGVNGLLVPNSDDPTELVSAMCTIAQPSVRQSLTEAAAARAGRYRAETMVVETLAVYREVASN